MFAVAPQSWYPPLESSGWCWWCCSVVVDLVGLSRWRVQAWPAGFCAALWSFQLVSPGGALVFVMPATLLHKTEKKKCLPFYVYEKYWQRVQCGSTKNLYSIVWLQKDLSNVSWETCWHTHTKTRAGVLPAKAQPNTHAQWSPIASHHFISLPLLSRLSFILMWPLLLFSATFPPFVFPGPSDTLSLLSGELDY